MRVFSRALCVAVLLGAMILPGQSHALLVSQCGGSYTGTSSCSFFAVGPNLSVTGSTTASGLVVKITDPSGNVHVLSCQGQYSCNASFGTGYTGTDSVGPPPGVGSLQCTVITSGSGSYRCESGL